MRDTAEAFVRQQFGSASIPSVTALIVRRGNLAKAHELSLRVNVTANEHEVAGALVREFAMKTPLLIVFIAAIVIGAGGGLAAMNNACKKGHHSWCASNYSPLHHANPLTQHRL